MPKPEKMTPMDFSIDEDLILVRYHARTKEEILRKMGGLLSEKGYVKSTFIQAIFDREETFPTGLETKFAGIAFPHTDTQHANGSAVAVATLAQPVKFRKMGAVQDEIFVTIIFMPVTNNPEADAPMLRKVISILENQDALLALQQATSKAQVIEAISRHFSGSST